MTGNGIRIGKNILNPKFIEMLFQFGNKDIPQ